MPRQETTFQEKVAQIVGGWDEDPRARPMTIALGPPPKKNRVKFPFKGTIDFQGLKIMVENPKGTFREGTDASGKHWKNLMHGHYGEIQKTEGLDGDKVDVYVGENPNADQVFVINQNHPKDHPTKAGKLDEQKTMLGFDSAEDAKKLYLSQYDDPSFFRSITHMSLDQFKDSLKECKGEKIAEDLKSRERVEVFGRKGNKYLTGLFNQQGIGTYGGGIDPGESPEETAQREYLEEAGYKLKNLKPIDIPPFHQPWTPEEQKFESDRVKEFPGGTLTRAYVADIVGRPRRNIETQKWLKDIRLRALKDLLQIQNDVATTTPEESVDYKRMQYRLQILKALNTKQAMYGSYAGRSYVEHSLTKQIDQARASGVRDDKIKQVLREKNITKPEPANIKFTSDGKRANVMFEKVSAEGAYQLGVQAALRDAGLVKESAGSMGVLNPGGGMAPIAGKSNPMPAPMPMPKKEPPMKTGPIQLPPQQFPTQRR